MTVVVNGGTAALSGLGVGEATIVAGEGGGGKGGGEVVER